MARSFGIVEKKLEESEFFLTKLEETIDSWPMSEEPQFYLSAFASATRSITFTLQASISDIPEFKEWYKKHQELLKASKLARYFLEARNLSQKVGYYLIGRGKSYKTGNGEHKMLLFFQHFSDSQLDYIPEEDILTSCKTYFKLLLNLILDCYKVFGSIIDPELFFTYENLMNTNKSIEDFEEQAGYPRGWTNLPDFSIHDRIELIARNQPKPTIDWIFKSYLGVNRFGEKGSI